MEDINDNSPYFVEPGSYTFSIPEDAEYGTSVGNVTARDKDLNPTLTYSIEAGANGYFRMPTKTSGNMFGQEFTALLHSITKPKVIYLLTK